MLYACILPLCDLQDKAKGDKEEASKKFKEISEAYDVLSGVCRKQGQGS